MEGWFGVSGGFGPGNRANVIIDRSGSLGSNQGYQPAEPQKSKSPRSIPTRLLMIRHWALYLPMRRFQRSLLRNSPRSSWTTGLGYRGLDLGSRADSMGEALSTVCEALRHPDGYYAPANLGPRIGTWLNSSPRPNWIDTTENTDKDFVSIGCGVMFIYYLMSEFNFSIDSVIAAAGTTFEELFQNLTGTSGAWSAFSNTVDAYFPIGTTYQPASDDILPRPGRAPWADRLRAEPGRCLEGESRRRPPVLRRLRRHHLGQSEHDSRQ